MKIATAKTVMASVVGAFCMAIGQAPQMAKAQEAGSVTPVFSISQQSVLAALSKITASGTRPGGENTRSHILPTRTARSRLPLSVLNRTNFYGFNPLKDTISPGLGALSQAGAPAAAFPTPAEWNPANLVNFGGTVGNTFGVVSAKQVNIYINCPDDSCWGPKGSITKFQANLNKSTFISITNQYVHSTASSRYPLGAQGSVNGTIPNTAPWGTPTLLDAVAQATADAAASQINSFGYGYIYHVFVPQGTDVCMDNSYSTCYSPDNPDTFVFCGYHNSFDDGSGHHILYTVEPFESVPGCSVSGQSVTDAQVTTLSHETFETITDPDPDFQWASLVGGEIGDECSVADGIKDLGLLEIYSVSLGTAKYNIQLEYSDKSFGCKATP